MITPEEILALRDFARLAKPLDIPFILVGAGARLVVFDWKYGFQSTRTTTDWDIGVQVSDWQAYERLRTVLTEGPHSVFARGRLAHRFRHRSGVEVDLLPFGGVEREDGTLAWPKNGSEMSVLGFREVLSNAATLDLGQGVTVPVATAPGLAVLKIFAFDERRKNDDLQDLYFIMTNYDRAGNEERIFDELSDLLSDRTLEYESAGAYLLGTDVRRLASLATCERLLPILATLTYPYASELTPLVARLGDERHEDAERIRISKLFKAFQTGIEAVSKK
jgi:predicted nucleotidyltransferase